MQRKFENLETFVLLDWFVADFESKFARYRLTGDYGFIQRALNASSKGRILLAGMKKPIQKISKELRLDIDQETIHTEIANGVWSNITFLSFGVEAKEIGETYAIHFIDKILENKMAMKTPRLLFKLFYLPPLPIATTDEGHIMHTQKGFTSIRKKRIEINIYPPRDYKSIFKNIVHEIFHVCFLQESKVGDTNKVESKVNTQAKIFFESCRDEWSSERIEMIKDLKITIEKKLSVFKDVENALSKFHKELTKAKFHIQTIMELLDAIADEKVKATLL